MINKYRWYEKLGLYAAVAVFLAFILAPFLEAFLVSLRPLEAVFRSPYRIITEDMSFASYFNIWVTVPGLPRYIFNSLLISTAATLLALACIIPAAYSVSRFNYRGRDLVLGALLGVNMVGATVLIIPLYKLMLGLGLLNTYWAMIIPGAAFTVPVGIFLMRSYFMRVPKELEEAAYVDGASRLYTLWRVILPVAAPGIVVVAVTVFLSTYAQQFLFALTFNSKDELHPLPIGLFAFFGRERVVYNELMAASLVGILPVLIAYVFLQKYIVAGLTAGAVKE
ncbi:Nucleoside ABC transporter, permease protein 1 [Candidatus Rhodobacter oscarellae]|uniref:Nucleoside ABC transporter, permease protein 1 n=1 Tax=Candidatus Rhodobacter oscarellae TaxID=1675527 RepID=A0A0J9EGC7_9RHOB|nr:carbohydrate ABC transporter permease [Candidatus Rhodobacter lobularis]KMW60719.1 Nucleoside ABC transporter, permease protein 1 [Candidatus Rhodobacter lobularis]